MSELVIRAATVEDAEAIGRVQVASWRVGYAGFYPQADLDALRWQERAEHWRTTVEASSENVLVGEGPQGVHGFVSYGTPRDGMPVAKGTFEVVTLYVVAEHWGDGTGAALMDAVVSLVDPAPIALWVLSENARGRRFYEKRGFVSTGETKTAVRNNRDVPQVMYLRAPAPTA